MIPFDDRSWPSQLLTQSCWVQAIANPGFYSGLANLITYLSVPFDEYPWNRNVPHMPTKSDQSDSLIVLGTRVPSSTLKWHTLSVDDHMGKGSELWLSVRDVSGTLRLNALTAAREQVTKSWYVWVSPSCAALEKLEAGDITYGHPSPIVWWF